MLAPNPYRIAARLFRRPKRWGATTYVKWFIKIVRILGNESRLHKYHQMFHFFRSAFGTNELIVNRTGFTNCKCARCTKPWVWKR